MSGIQVFRGVKLNLDRERYLLFDLNAIEALEDKLGRDLIGNPEGWNFNGAREIKAFLWAAMLRDDTDLWTKPPAITLEQVGALITPENLAQVVESLTKAKQVSSPDAEQAAGDEESPLATASSKQSV
jgi:hypothetical protein